MPLKALVSAMLIGLSGAALAQVNGALIEQKSGNSTTGGNDLAPLANGASSAGAGADNAQVTPDTPDHNKR